MNNQALVDALIKFQNWCDEWPKIRDHIDALAAENAKLQMRIIELEGDWDDIHPGHGNLADKDDYYGNG